MPTTEIDKSTRDYFLSLIDEYKFADISDTESYINVLIVFGIDNKQRLVIKSITDDRQILIKDTPTLSNRDTIDLYGHVITILWKRNAKLTIENNTEQPKISSLPETEEIIFENISMEKFQDRYTQEVILLCLERHKDGTKEHLSQLRTIQRLTDIFPLHIAILWCIWLSINNVFSTMVQNKVAHRYLLADEALQRLYDGTPVIITFRSRLIKQLSTEQINLASEFDIIQTRKMPLYTYIFDLLIIPYGDDVIILDMIHMKRYKETWNNIIPYLNRGTIGYLHISNDLGEIIEDEQFYSD